MTQIYGQHYVMDLKIISQPDPRGGGLNTFYSGGYTVLHTPTNFWTTVDAELKFYMVMDIHKLFPKLEKN